MGARKGSGKRGKGPAKLPQTFCAKFQSEPERHFPIFTITMGFLQLLFTWNIISPEPFYFNYGKRYQLWRYFTLALVHSGTFHLSNNLPFLLLYGIKLEIIHGWRRIMIIFFAGTAAAELAMPLVFVLSDNAESEGSSSGVFALISAYLVSAILNPHLVSKFGGLLVLISIYSCLSEPFIYKYVQMLLPHCKHPNNSFAHGVCDILIDWLSNHFSWNGMYSHLTGAVTGIVVGLAILKITGSPKSWKDRMQRWASILAAICGGYLVASNLYWGGKNGSTS